MKLMRRVAAILSMLAILGAAACGGSDKPAGSSTPANNTPAGNNLSLTSAQCLSAAHAMAVAASGAAGFGSSGSQNPDEAVETLRRVAGAAPDAIKTDVELVADATRDFYDALKAAGVDFSNPSTFQDPQKAAAAGTAAQAYQNSGAPAAAQRIGTYFDSVCPGARG